MVELTDQDYNELLSFFKMALHNVEKLTEENEALKKQANELSKKASAKPASVFSSENLDNLKNFLNTRTTLSKEASEKICKEMNNNPNLAISLILNLTKSSSYEADGKTFGSNSSYIKEEDPWLEAITPSNR